MKKTVFTITCILLLLQGCVTTKPVSGLDDPFEKQVKFSSASFSEPLMLIYQSADPFFRGWLNKKTLKQNHQLYIRVNSGNEFEDWSTLVYLKDGEAIEVKTNRVSYDVKGKAFYEDITANLSIVDIKWLSTQEKVQMRLKSGRTSDLKIDFAMKGEEASSYLKSISTTINSLQ